MTDSLKPLCAPSEKGSPLNADLRWRGSVGAEKRAEPRCRFEMMMTRSRSALVALAVAAGIVASPGPASGQDAKIAEPSEQTVAAPDTSEASESARSFEARPLAFRLYGDAQAMTSDGESAATFSTGGVDLFATSRPSERVSLLAEVLFEPGEDNTFALDVERLMAEYLLDERFIFGMGRYHTSIGYYNTAFHHGTYFQAATARPSIFSFEDDEGALPVHGVGVWGRGAFNTQSLGIRYVVELSNGRPGHSDAEAVQNVQDEDKRKAFNIAVTIEPKSVSGLQAGASYYRDRVTTASGRVGESILAVHTVYTTLSEEAMVEAMRIRHSGTLPGRQLDSWAVYAQVSRSFGRFRPYVRYQWIDFERDDPAFASFADVDGPSLGLRFDPADSIAFKLQVDRKTEAGSKHRNVVTLQAAFGF